MNTYKIKLETTKTSPVSYNTNHAYFFIKGEAFPVGYLKDEQPYFWGFHANRFELGGRTFVEIENSQFSNEELDALHKQAQQKYASMKGEMYAKGIIVD